MMIYPVLLASILIVLGASITACGNTASVPAPEFNAHVAGDTKSKSTYNIDTLVVAIQIDSGTVYDIISEINQKVAKRVLITFEEDRNDTGHKTAIIRRDVALPQLLNEISGMSGAYSWQLDGRIINVYPTRSLGDKSDLMNQIIDSIDFTDKTKEEIMRIILDKLDAAQPGKFVVKKVPAGTVYKVMLAPFPYEDFGLVPPVAVRHSINDRNISVREVLNMIAEAEDEPWEAIYHPDKALDLRLLRFRVAFPRTLPDASQPPLRDTKSILDEVNEQF